VVALTLATTGSASAGLLLGVGCHRGMVCIAVGSYIDPHAPRYLPLVEHLGKDVVRQRVPIPRGSRGSQLSGISCPSRTSCVAVGYTTDPNGHQLPLVERWNRGSWSAETIRPFPGPGGSELASVSCPSTDTCTAIGSSNGQPLVERWNGHSWSRQEAVPLPGASASFLDSVSCASPQRCLAVGSYRDENRHLHPVAEIWDGSAWSITPPPYSPSRTSADLTGVSRVSVHVCIAVAGGIIQRWDGSRWSPETSRHNHIHLQAVSCTSQSSCMAVGRYLAPGDDGPYAEVWNGRRWSTRRPQPPGTEDEFLAVSCAAPGRCAAAGQGIPHDLFAALSEHWDGRHWTNFHWY
jgi:hypothetical protein